VDEIATELEEEGYKEIPSSVIGAKVMRRLEAIDHVAYVRYASVYRQFEDVGEFIFGQVVEFGDEGIQFGAEALALGRIRDAMRAMRSL